MCIRDRYDIENISDRSGNNEIKSKNLLQLLTK